MMYIFSPWDFLRRFFIFIVKEQICLIFNLLNSTSDFIRFLYRPGDNYFYTKQELRLIVHLL